MLLQRHPPNGRRNLSLISPRPRQQDCADRKSKAEVARCLLIAATTFRWALDSRRQGYLRNSHGRNRHSIRCGLQWHGVNTAVTLVGLFHSFLVAYVDTQNTLWWFRNVVLQLKKIIMSSRKRFFLLL